jgi:hypothetical protein
MRAFTHRQKKKGTTLAYKGNILWAEAFWGVRSWSGKAKDFVLLRSTQSMFFELSSIQVKLCQVPRKKKQDISKTFSVKFCSSP